MVLNSVFFFVCNFIGSRTGPRLKQTAPLTHGRVEEFQTANCLTLSSSGKMLEGERCCVCLSSMEEGKGVETSVLPCHHQFHKVCVDRWFEECRKTCPICRFSMEGQGGEAHKSGTQILTDEMVIWFSSFHTSGF